MLVASLIGTILTFNYWVGLENSGVIAGLASCDLMMSILDTASSLLLNPRSMFFSQLVETVITPLVFWIFNSAYRLGDPEGSYPAPYALMYGGIALLGVEGFGSLPKHCLNLYILAAILINLVTQLLKKFETKYRIYRFIPSPMCIAIPFYLGVASGLICGDSLWGISASILALPVVKAPFCLKV
uniref:Oligopeptide transporter OPT family n=1 Tax=Solanum tuberosum TaxID=4113 RepID=M1BYF8_SOLTU